jgi:hypothetical protein
VPDHRTFQTVLDGRDLAQGNGLSVRQRYASPAANKRPTNSAIRPVFPMRLRLFAAAVTYGMGTPEAE